ncbi:glutamine amidotransferase, class I [Luminiphilus syltensis NOR5-1B]|uniref:Glutamine amidotransferase, class I n=1 Tax=Luminiphilus syltensis NOR5-1B TaxID=565045 RepID=B8KUM4_9GAMM|nr:GMP synthase [Luminiphilus syltensis]EED35928.1 glutamine amidotransferase, class I [Luminiphilus syltensis NOR5-1B]
MKIGILKTDAVRPEWVPEFGEYPDMFQRLLSAEDPSLEFRVWDVEAGEFPEGPDEADVYLITGSKSSVYEDKDWIRRLEQLVRDLLTEERKVAGICFGHQLIAQALGGRVQKSEKGWGVGCHRYDITDPELTDDQGKQLQLLVSHQDQVMAAPEGATVTVRSDFCPMAGLKLGDKVMTFQAHPEFVPGYSEEIMSYRYDQIGADRVAEGRDSLQQMSHQGDRVARWLLDFFRG